ncbi:L,D-transpeptidase family protein [Geothrix mesophila]|uniref:L,D-transpeptidase family protein n=1 Tax=Geothrix mesophila TaxID=2922723 RepID=UPI001FAB3668
MIDPILAARYRALVLANLARPGSPVWDPRARVAVVDAARQRLGLLEDGRLVFEGVVSTAKNGLGCEENSYRTPTGWHRILARIGAGAEPGAVFRAQQPTGEVWRGEPRDEDLILTRVLTLDGLEEGWNRGPGRDSRLRWIYLHGTNQEQELGTPVSHGCVRLSNADVVALFDRMAEGDLLLIAEDLPDDDFGLGRLHFAGVAGSGMSALAQFACLKGGRASGSDRSFDRGQRSDARRHLEDLGVVIHPQDGSGLTGDCTALVVSTAVEDEVPDVATARRLGVPVLHRSELLAHVVAKYRTVAVTGTSGKSTTTAMVFEILRGAGRDPSVITGGELVALQREGRWGNAWAGASDLLVIEADESDGSVVRYHAAVGVILNLQKDHKDMAVVAEMFRAFRAQVREAAVVGEAENLREFAGGATVFGFGGGARLRAEGLVVRADSSAFRVGGKDFVLPMPGLHNVENALAAIAACSALGVPLEEMIAPLAAFQGVARRFQVLGTRRGVTVVDDFGHNPAKVAASIRAAHLRTAAGGRVLAVFQPHGFGPLKFLRSEFVEAFVAELASRDRLWFLDVFYAGGTAARDITSAEVVAEIAAKGVAAEAAPSREWLVDRLAAEAKAGDLILVMGARDPSLTDLAKAILAAL